MRPTAFTPKGVTSRNGSCVTGYACCWRAKWASYVIGYLRRLLGTAKLSKRKPLQAAVTYFENNREYMKYDEYLAQGYPIGSGVAEGACRHVVKDRMEQTGMRWAHSGAQSMLHLRAIYLNGDWDDYLEHHIETEQATLYGKKAA